MANLEAKYQIIKINSDDKLILAKNNNSIVYSAISKAN